MNTRSLVLVAVAIAIAIGGYLALRPSGSLPVADLSPVGAAAAADVDTSAIVEMSLGNAEAPVTMIEYASFTCPHCRDFHEDTFNQIKADYVDTGKVHFIYREVYFDRFGLWAAMIARCAGPEKYFGIADLIYEQQRDWTAGGDPATIADNLRRIGISAGLTREQADACLQDGEMAQAMVAAYQKNAERDGINSTPSFLIDGKKYGNLSFAEFSRVLDEKLGN